MPNPTFVTQIDPAADAPRAFLLEVWRKVDRSIDHYFDSRRIARPVAAALERFLETEPALGKSVADDLRALRAQYDRIEHSRSGLIPSNEANEFGARAFRVMRVFTSGRANAV